MIPVHLDPKFRSSLSIWALIPCVALLLFGFRHTASDLLTAWGTEEYSHGPFIPFIAALLAWHKLTEAPPLIRPSWWGVAVLVIAGGLWLFADLSAFSLAAEYSFVIALFAISISCLGWRAVRVVAPALIYLIFAIPLPHLLQTELSQNLQLLSSDLGVWLLDTANVPVFQEGNVIDLGGYRLEVAEACSGLRYLFPLMSFGYLVANLVDDRLWKRILIFLSTIPISIALNGLRIMIIGVTVDLWGQQMASGFIHIFEGWVIFCVCLTLLMAETQLLLHIGKHQGRFRYKYIGFAHGRLFGSSDGNWAPSIVTLMATACLAIIFGAGQFGRAPETIPPHISFASFPTQLGDWKGHPDRLAPDVLASLQLTDYWLADYKDQQVSTPVNLYIAYYDRQRNGQTTHSPSNCIPGGGWQIAQSHVISIALADTRVLAITRMVIRKDHARALVYYWFDERGRDLTENYYAKWYLFWDSIKMHRTDGALVRLVTPLSNNETEIAGDDRLHRFLDQSYSTINNRIPGAVITSTLTTP
jgi:exosortase D (VPLPA-CTERM-specific)